jgi:hypothetical protein
LQGADSRSHLVVSIEHGVSPVTPHLADRLRENRGFRSSSRGLQLKEPLRAVSGLMHTRAGVKGSAFPGNTWSANIAGFRSKIVTPGCSNRVNRDQTGRSRDVRITPDSNRIADVAGGPFRAQLRKLSTLLDQNTVCAKPIAAPRGRIAG